MGRLAAGLEWRARAVHIALAAERSWRRRLPLRQRPRGRLRPRPSASTVPHRLFQPSSFTPLLAYLKKNDEGDIVTLIQKAFDAASDVSVKMMDDNAKILCYSVHEEVTSANDHAYTLMCADWARSNSECRQFHRAIKACRAAINTLTH